MAGEAKKWWGDALQTFVAVILALISYGFLEKLLLSKIATKLENLISGGK